MSENNTTTPLETAIAENLSRVRQRIELACVSAGRSPDDVQLLAVSKRKPLEAVEAAIRCGQQAFGESYLQDALAKVSVDLGADIEWHFIGPIQSNKTRDIASHFDWVHGVDRAKIATRLNEQRSTDLPPLDVCLQVNISEESAKSGVEAHELSALAAHVAGLPRLRLRGLMCLPARSDSLEAQRQPFRHLAELQRSLIAEGHVLDTLSMGMSGDLEAAIIEGATIVRVGTDIFGARE